MNSSILASLPSPSCSLMAFCAGSGKSAIAGPLYSGAERPTLARNRENEIRTTVVPKEFLIVVRFLTTSPHFSGLDHVCTARRPSTRLGDCGRPGFLHALAHSNVTFL